MGGGGGGTFRNRPPERLTQLVRSEEAKEFDVELSGFLNELLGKVNGRDVPLVEERLNEIKDHLQDEVESRLDSIFGGSVAKHTWVDGLSDIDSLLIVNGTKFHNQSPARILEQVEAILKDRLHNVKAVSHGEMAVTVEYPDEMSVQLLPAIRDEGRMRIPSPRGRGWASIDPVGFRDALRKANADCGGKLIPTIKLAKAVIGTWHESQRLSGYHVESLGISAFRDYKGVKTPSAMLTVFFEKAKDLVLSPIKDRTGQSVHVDEDLGAAGSIQRQKASHLLAQTAKRMRNATGAASTGLWKELFGIE
jgi:hypothetical protein